MSYHEIHADFTAVRNTAQATAETLVQARTFVEDALTILYDVGADMDTFVEVTNTFENIRQQIGRLLLHVAHVPNTINPYLDRNGMPPVAPLDIRPSEFTAVTTIPKAAPEASEAPNMQYYRQCMDEIDEQLNKGVDPENIEGYIASGGTCHVFLDTETGHVIKMPRVLMIEDDDFTPEIEDVAIPPATGVVDELYRIPLERGKGVPGLEQIIGAIGDGGQEGKGAVICQFVSGKYFRSMNTEEIEAIPEEHYDQLANTIEALADRKLTPDNDRDNLLYSPDKGFTVIDYATVEQYNQETHDDQTFTALQIAINMIRPVLMLGGTNTEHRRKFNAAIRRKLGNENADIVETMWDVGRRHR